MRTVLQRILRMMCLLLAPATLVAQHDTAYVRTFVKKNDIELNSGVYNRSFLFKRFASDAYLTDHKLLANTSAYIGATIDYNWASISFSANIPYTAVSRLAPAIKALGFGFRKIRPHYQFDMVAEKYSGLLLPINRHDKDFDYLSNVNYLSAMARVTYIVNAKHFSLSAALNYANQQVKSAGSLLFNLTPSWQQFHLTGPRDTDVQPADSAFVRVVSGQPSVISLVANGGYTYNFIFGKGHWNINPFAWGGMGAQRETNVNEHIRPVLTYRFQLNVGYNSDTYYLYLNASYERSIGHLANSEWIKNSGDIYFTAGYRIGKLKKKLLGIL